MLNKFYKKIKENINLCINAHIHLYYNFSIVRLKNLDFYFWKLIDCINHNPI